MKVMMYTKKVFWIISASVVSILAWITNALQMVRNIVLLVLELPLKAVGIVMVFTGIAGAVALAIQADDIGGAFGAMLSIGIVFVLTYVVIKFLYKFFYALVGMILALFDFDAITDFLVRRLQRIIYRYMGELRDEDTTPMDNVLFAVPWLIYKIDSILNKLKLIVSILIFGVFGAAGAYFGYKEVFSTDPITTLDHVFGWIMVALVTVFFLYLGYCVDQAVRTAAIAASPLDELFCVYAEFFRNNATRAKSGKTGSGHADKEREEDKSAQSTPKEKNPYYDTLKVAKSYEELRKLYRKLAMETHPDTNHNGSTEDANRRMAQLNEAFDMLKKQF